MADADKPVVYILHGDDPVEIAKFVDGMIAKSAESGMGDLNLSRLDARSDSDSDLRTAAMAMPFLAERRVPLLIDPILEPIGFGFAESLGRYLDVRRRFPDAEMMMGIGNLTELTDVDSAGINVLLARYWDDPQFRRAVLREKDEATRQRLLNDLRELRPGRRPPG